jgi:hypothetical protein
MSALITSIYRAYCYTSLVEIRSDRRKLPDADLDLVSGGTTTVGGTAFGRGRVITNGGNNLN